MLPKVFSKGDKVNIQYNNKNLLIETSGKLLSAAAIGDTVKAKLQNGKIINVIVNDPRVASVAND